MSLTPTHLALIWIQSFDKLGTMMPDAAILSELVTALDVIVIECLEHGRCRVVGELPEWCEVVYPAVAAATEAGENPYALEAFAVRIGSHNLLGLERLGVAHERARAVLQKAREASLDYYRLSQAEAALRTSHDDLVSILNELRIGTAMLDARGHVTFLSQVCQQLFGTRGDQVLGRHWEEISPFTAEANTALIAMTERPVPERVKVPVELKTATQR